MRNWRQQAAETQNRVQNVEVRAAKAAQPGVVPTYADVNDNFTFKPRGVLQVDYATFNERAGGYQFNDGTDIRRAPLRLRRKPPTSASSGGLMPNM
jgi:phosphate-selective porin OprO/OprP